MSKYTVIVTLYDQFDAESESEAYDLMMDALSTRCGMEVSHHEIIQDDDIDPAQLAVAIA